MRIGKAHRSFIKERFGKAAAGNLVDDREKLGFQRKAQEAAEQTANAQIQAANRGAMSGTEVQAGALKDQAREVAEVGNEAQIKAASAAEQYEAALEAQREDRALAGAERLKQQNRQDVAGAVKVGLQGLEIGSMVAKNFSGGLLKALGV